MMCNLKYLQLDVINYDWLLIKWLLIFLELEEKAISNKMGWNVGITWMEEALVLW
jgi:hypothetical protein